MNYDGSGQPSHYAPVNDAGLERYSGQGAGPRHGGRGGDSVAFMEDRQGSKRSGESRRERPNPVDEESRRSSRKDSRTHSRSRSRDRDRRRPSRRDGAEHERDREREKERERERERERHSSSRRHRSRSRDRGGSHREYERYKEDRHASGHDDYGGAKHRSGRDYGSSYSYGFGGGGGRRRSPSPARPFGGMSPARGSVPALEERPRQLHNWDAAPKGFERISADKAKLTGLFPPPGNIAKLTNFQPPVLDPARAAMLSMLTGDDGLGEGIGPSLTLQSTNTASLSKQTRRLYVAGFPYHISEDQLVHFLNRTIKSVVPASQDAVIGVQISQDRNYAFVDFKSAEDATTLVGFDGIAFDDGSPLRIRRPREYSEAAEASNQAKGVLASIASFSPELNKVTIQGLPVFITEAHLQAMLEPFGKVKTCLILANPITNQSTGIGIFEFQEPGLLNRDVCEALNGFLMDSYTLHLREISDVNEDDPHLLSTLSFFGFAPNAVSASPTPVLQLLNMVSEDDLGSDQKYSDFRDDVYAEACQYGSVKSVEIPRPAPQNMAPGAGKVFVEYASQEECMAALNALSGRKYDDRTVIAAYFPVERFNAKLF